MVFKPGQNQNQTPSPSHIRYFQKRIDVIHPQNLFHHSDLRQKIIGNVLRTAKASRNASYHLVKARPNFNAQFTRLITHPSSSPAFDPTALPNLRYPLQDFVTTSPRRSLLNPYLYPSLKHSVPQMPSPPMPGDSAKFCRPLRFTIDI